MKPTYYLTAYGIALKHGFKGSEEEWLNSLTAFYLAQQAGFTGTVDEWLQVLNDPVPRFGIGEVKTLEGGSEATVSITGDKENPILNFGIPRGLGMEDALPLVGGKMKGAVDMDSHGIHNLPEPKAEGDAVNQKYADAIKKIAQDAGTAAKNAQGTANDAKTAADNAATAAGKAKTAAGDALTASKAYTDGKHLPLTATITTEWSGDAAPFTQTVAVEGILKEDWPHVMPVYSEALETALAEKEAWACVSDAKTVDGSIVFSCFEDKPTTAILIQIEVNR